MMNKVSQKPDLDSSLHLVIIKGEKERKREGEKERKGEREKGRKKDIHYEILKYFKDTCEL